MDFRPNIAVVEIIKEVAFGRTYLETFIPVLIVNGIEIHGKDLMC